MWVWDQSAGTLSRNGLLEARGYAGRNEGVNNPDMQGVKAVGPVPRGRWHIGAPYHSKNTGPFTLPLIANDGTKDDIHQPTGRSAFRIHGDNAKGNRSASHGCIILSRAIREKIWSSGDRDLEVVA